MIRINIIKPSIWVRVIPETANTRANPQDGEAWGRLGKAYKEAIMERRGFLYGPAGERMYQLSQEAYQKAVTLLPNDADWHNGFADLLCWNAEWSSIWEWADDSITDWRACFAQVKQILDIDPEHEKANRLLQMYAHRMAYQSNGAEYVLVDLSGLQPDYLILTPGL